jgi:alpha-glucosidase (family GH31 glycosyl hydrolase)
VLSVRAASGPLRVHFFTHATAFARLRAFLRLTGLPPVLPEWAYGYGPSLWVAPVLEAGARGRGRWRRRCGANRRAAVPPPGWRTARSCAGGAANGRVTPARADVTFRVI